MICPAMWRLCVSALLLYITLDLADPQVPGALNFDPDECVEAVDVQKTRPPRLPAAVVAVAAAGPPATFEGPPVPISVKPSAPLMRPRVAHARAPGSSEAGRASSGSISTRWSCPFATCGWPRSSSASCWRRMVCAAG
jgi:hypothetical protein